MAESELAKEIKQSTGQPASTLNLDSGLDVGIYHGKMRHIPELLKFVTNILTWVQSVGGLGYLVGSLQEGADKGEVASEASLILKLLENRYYDTVSLLCLFTDITDDQFNDLDFDEGVAVVEGIWEVNKSFFMTRVLPRVQAMVAQMDTL